MFRFCLLTCVLLGGVSASAQPDRPLSHFGGQVSIGTTGPRLAVISNVIPSVNVRLSTSVFTENLIPVDIDTDQDIEGNAFNLDNEIDYFQAGVRADYYPISQLRLSTGLFYAKRDVKSTISALEPITEGNVTFTPDQVGRLNVGGSFGSRLAPYLGVGFGNAIKQGGLPVGFHFELGGYYHGTPDIRLSVDDPDSVIAPSATEANERALEEQLGWYKFYPEVSLGLTVRFN